MAIQSSVLVLASLLFAAHALGGLRAKGGLNQNISVEANVEYHSCPNKRFPCEGRCEVMHRRCQKELDGCDAETPNRKHCPLTKCFSKCGCGKSQGSHAMTCHQRFRISLEPRLIGWLKSMHLDPGGRWGSILGVFLEQNYMRSLLEIMVLHGKARVDANNRNFKKK